MSVSDAKLLQEQGYDFIGEIGEGAYSKVKLFYSKTLKQKVAIKIINRQLAPRDFVKNFLPREIEILQKVKHKHIVNIYEILATSDGRIFIVLEYSSYNDLLRHIQVHGALDEQRAKHLFGQLVEAVQYLHSNNIVHRDLKCENLLLTSTEKISPMTPVDIDNMSSGRLSATRATENVTKIKPVPLSNSFDCSKVKLLLTDFGFSRAYTDNDKSRTFCGSAAYAAPEIIQGIPYRPTTHDTWSLGVVLFIMVCGTMPYNDSNVRQMVKEQLAHRVRFSPQSAYNLSVACKDLICQLIEPNTEKRLTVKQIQQHPWLANRFVNVNEIDTTEKEKNLSISTLGSSYQNTQSSQIGRNEGETFTSEGQGKDSSNISNRTRSKTTDTKHDAKMRKNSVRGFTDL